MSDPVLRIFRRLDDEEVVDGSGNCWTGTVGQACQYLRMLLDQVGCSTAIEASVKELHAQHAESGTPPAIDNSHATADAWRRDRGRIGRDNGAEQPAAQRDRIPLFAPGPGDFDGWRRVVADGSFDFRAPAVKPGVRVLADGMALVVDSSRADHLRCGGNGVVALQAAAAFVGLAKRN